MSCEWNEAGEKIEHLKHYSDMPGISYLSLLGNRTSLNMCRLVIVILVLIQGHRVIGFLKTLLAAGAPLNSKPYHETS